MELLNKLQQTLLLIGQNEELRSKTLTWFKEIEELLHYPQGSIRDEITGPILDAMYNENNIFRKQLSNGLVFDFYYRTKIARDFLMSTPEVPDHVWEPQTTKLLLLLSKNLKQVLIGGAYFGDQAILLANEIKNNNGVVHAFEPNLDQFNMLNHNAKINGLNNLKAWRMGLWKDSESSFRLVGEDSFAHAESVVNETTQVNKDIFSTVSIGDYLEREQIRKLDLIMLDIEGLEYSVLQGAEKQLNLPDSEAPTIVFEVHRSYVDWSNGLQNSEIIKYLKKFGYSVFAIRDYNSNVDMTNLPIEIIPPDRVFLEGPPHGFNMLAVKDTSILNSTSFKICYDVSPKLLKHKNSHLHQPTNEELQI
ncbi:FkbM family methyltransferase [Paenibacillus polymyxa]|uniref:FkbM family methyltransferase n=1 Tax=Paenibacillus polymyxa TaxID=1406 RepID=UPI002024696F|nr:FkbM family methyltransferase [Paenibacillus polymyxa]MDU8673306.1 FkbM family methyltransferase [Paenibacillus polymyxa]MDU8698212.1 FkbM family methyltransferase [Paenibacillus polymyxa]URJ57353.1 FkbM family methyltransferase [Paenibacillus polymyxa]URJ64772.1 FkbM family methyltransferase [Paenibacillus polymyxa]URJ71856.1 FkbM family methyltransferase [Paenibacillus polymyxa]